jgi:protein-disulfide isomerase
MAKVTIELFSDFQCPACKALHQQTLKPFIAD